jgi:type VI secretion system protein VasD
MARLLPLALFVSLLGCGSAPPPEPAAPPKPCKPLEPTFSITATRRVNAVASGEGRPLQIRIYQLKSDARLRAASFEDIWQNDRKALDTDLVTVEQHTIFPGESKDFSVAPSPDAQSLAIVALFREPQGKDWFLTYEVTPPGEPPCPAKPAPVPVWIDRMQIQDGSGRDVEAEAEGSEPPVDAPTESGGH